MKIISKIIEILCYAALYIIFMIAYVPERGKYSLIIISFISIMYSIVITFKISEIYKDWSENE